MSGEKTVPYLLQEHIPVLELLVQRRDSGHAWLIGGHGRRLAAVNHLEWCRPKSRLEGGVVDEFRPRQPAQPTARAITCQTAKVYAQDTVSHLRLAIRLGMERRTEAELDAGQLEELLPKGAGEHGIPVTHNGARDSMEANNLIEERPCNGGRRVGVPKRDEVRILGEAIDDREHH